MINYSINSNNVKYAVRDILLIANEAKAKGHSMKYLNIGDPLKFDHKTPLHMIEAIHKSMLDGNNGYAPSSGTEEAIAAIKREAKRKNIENIQDVFVTMGASEAIELTLSSLTNPGDNILTPYPGYPIYTAIQAKLALEENPYYLDEENKWMPDPEDIRKKINSKTKAIVLINPNNPTGSLATKEILSEIIKIAKENNLLILSDEIYDKLTYDGKNHISTASLAKDHPVVTFNGISKSYVAPGFRIGWGIVSGDKKKLSKFLETINKLLRARLCASTPMMAAIPAALDGPQDHIKELMNKMHLRRDLTYNMLNDIEGITCVKPEGAFYAFPKIDAKSDMEFVKQLILEKGVVVVPGSGFGQKPGSQHFRVVFLPNEETLKKAYSDIKDFMENIWRKNNAKQTRV
jgi:alanine-synthesizing transaminase